MNAQFSIRIPDDLMDRLQKIADEKKIKVPALLRCIAQDYAEQTNGIEERVRRLEIAVLAIEEEMRKEKESK